MKSIYPLVPLGEVLTPSSDAVLVEPEKTYRPVGIFSFGRGLFERSAITGAETKYRHFLRLHEGQFVMSRLKAWEGAVGVVPRHLDGAVVSNEYPTFKLNGRLLDPDYLGWLCRWPEFWEGLMKGSKGIGARRERVHTEELLSLDVPLPSIESQRRIVSRMDSLSTRVNTASDLTVDAANLSQALLASLLQKQAGSAHRVTLESILTQIKRGELPLADKQYRLLGARWYAEGLWVKAIKLGIDIKSTRLFKVEANDFVYNRLFAWKGSFAVVTPLLQGSYVSGEFPVFRANPDHVDITYLWAWFSQPTVWEDASLQSSGGTPTSRNRLREERFMAMEIPLPLLTEQKRLGRVARSLQTLRELGRSSTTVLDALVLSALGTALNSRHQA